MARYRVRLSGSADSSTHDSHPLHTLDMPGSKQLVMRLKNKSNRHRDTKLTTIKAIGNMLDFISKLRTLYTLPCPWVRSVRPSSKVLLKHVLTR